MATTTTMEDTALAIARVNRTRALSVAGAAIAALAVWAVAVPLLGLDLLVRFGNGAPQAVGIDFVLGASLVASLFGWGLLAVLERRTSRARTIWTAVAIVVVLVSLSLPLSTGITMSTRAALGLMHVAVAAVLIPALRRGSPRRSGSTPAQWRTLKHST
jgi:predicted permease